MSDPYHFSDHAVISAICYLFGTLTVYPTPFEIRRVVTKKKERRLSKETKALPVNARVHAGYSKLVLD